MHASEDEKPACSDELWKRVLDSCMSERIAHSEAGRCLSHSTNILTGKGMLIV